jgi:hypothetical protein
VITGVLCFGVFSAILILSEVAVGLEPTPLA